MRDGHPKPDRRSRRRAEQDPADTDASGWLAAQFQESPDPAPTAPAPIAPAPTWGPGPADAPSGSPAAEWRDVGRSPAAPDADAPPTIGPAITASSAPPAAPAGGFRWGLTPQASPAGPAPADPVALPQVRPVPEPSAQPMPQPAARPAPDPAAHAPGPAHPAAGVAGDPFLPADPQVPIVPPGLPVVAAPDLPPAAAPPLPTTAVPDWSVVPPPDRVLPTELFSPVQPGEPTEPLVSRRTFQPRVSDLPDAAAAPTQRLPAAAPLPPLIPATGHRENEDSPLAALFREREHHLPAAEPTVQFSSVLPAVSGSQAPRGGPAGSGRPPGSGRSGNRKLLLWGGGALLVVLVLVGLFFLGTKLPELFGSAPVPAADTRGSESAALASPTPSVTPSPSPSAPPVTAVAAVGPLTPGTYPWEKLRGGECLGGYQSPWAEEFTVVDCAGPHPAQMVHRGVFGPDDASAYPGIAALQAQINLLCSAPTVIDFAAAGAYNDIRVAGSFAATDKEWVAGHRDYFCFVTRGSAEPLTGSVAVPVG